MSRRTHSRSLKTRRRSIIASVSLLAMSAVAAHGQNANGGSNSSGSGDTQLAPIVVTGTAAGQPPATGTVGQPPEVYAGGQVAKGARLGALGNKSVLKTPFSITAFTAKLIRDQQARTVADLTLNDPSVRADAPVYSERDSFFIRGFSVVNLDVLYDGLPYLANPRRSSLEGVERVEVLKGPTAFVNGGIGRVGGTINLIPKRASDEPLTRLTTTYISDGQAWSHADIGRRYGPAGEWGIRANGSYRFGDTPMDHNEIKVGVGALGLDYQGEDVRASLDLNYSNQKIDAPTSLFNAAAARITIPSAPDGSINTANPFEYHDSTHKMAAARIEYDLLDNTTLYAAAGASRYREDFLTSSYTINNVNGTARSELSIQPQQIDGYSGEIGIRSEFDTGPVNHKVNLSLQKSLNENHRGGFAPGALGLPGAYTTNIYSPSYLPSSAVSGLKLPKSDNLPLFADLLSTSIAFSDTLGFFDERLEVTLGGRYQEMRQRGWNTNPNNGPIGDQNYYYDEGRFSPAVGANFRATENLSVYANYVEALTEGAVAAGNTINAGEIFSPFVSKQKELGFKYDAGNVVLTAALFEIRQASGYRETIPNPNPPGPATVSIYRGNGMQINRGIELSAFGEPIDGLRLLGGVTLMDAELERTSTSSNNGKDAPGVPKTAVSLYGEYDLPAVENLTLTGRVVYSGSTYFDAANAQKIEDWTRVDLGARYKFERENGKPIEIRANVENVFNENYWASSARGFLAAGAPRTFMVSASFDF
ncbi:TonB-dependent siderophore receptor [Rhizobium sp. AQ_MP]|uniref:TonB-dependent receptor n=1 Tax=Rhizobium sp. AQ_MP TaxID=2761536 RepID=UPI001FEE2CA0|nr:TonB-dependent siderophore receptor [Rhizobium sp. AQ_MP]